MSLHLYQGPWPFGAVLARDTARRRAWRPAHGPVAWAVQAWRRRSTRRLLGDLDERMLKDIGASRSDALIEASKPFWRP